MYSVLHRIICASGKARHLLPPMYYTEYLASHTYASSSSRIAVKHPPAIGANSGDGPADRPVLVQSNVRKGSSIKGTLPAEPWDRSRSASLMIQSSTSLSTRKDDWSPLPAEQRLLVCPTPSDDRDPQTAQPSTRTLFHTIPCRGLGGACVAEQVKPPT